MKKVKKVGLGQNNLKSKLFYFSLVAIPTLQFLFFWVYVNFNSILMAFKVFQQNSTAVNSFEWGIKNFMHWFSDSPKWRISSLNGGFAPKYNSDHLWSALLVTFKSYGISLFIGVPLGLFFSYYMFKKMPGAGIFRVVLFMPSIISAAPISLIYKFLMLKVVGNPSVMGGNGLFDVYFFSTDNMYGTMMTFSLLIGFGTSVLMYTNKMDSIAPEIIESAHLDGANGFKEFWYIVLPQAFSIVQVFLITGFAGAFTAQYNAFTLFDPSKAIPEITSLGFLLWNGVRHAGERMWVLGPYAALGLLVTLFVAPATFFLRWFFNKYGWKEE